MWRYSRQHQELMLKGATSGNYLNVRKMLYDCDADALVVRVQATRPRLPHRRADLLLPGARGGRRLALSQRQG